MHFTKMHGLGKFSKKSFAYSLTASKNNVRPDKAERTFLISVDGITPSYLPRCCYPP